MKKQAANLVLVNPSEYFQGAIAGALTQLKVSASEHAKSYLVGLLTKFLTAENLKDETLVEQLASALEQESTEAKCERFRHLGDYSLYIAGFFADSLNRKLVDVDYYIGMGGTAYEAVAQLYGGKNDAQLFSELAGKFPQFVDVFSQVSEESSFPRDTNNLLRTYELWAKTGSQRLARQLAKAGFALDKGQAQKKNGTDS